MKSPTIENNKNLSLKKQSQSSINNQTELLEESKKANLILI